MSRLLDGSATLNADCRNRVCNGPPVVDSSLELFRVEAFEVTGHEDTKYDVWAISSGFPAVNGTIQWGEFEDEFKVELSLSTATVSHEKQGFRILTPDGGVAAGF